MGGIRTETRVCQRDLPIWPVTRKEQMSFLDTQFHTSPKSFKQVANISTPHQKSLNKTKTF